MARGVNKVILVGSLGKDPEMRYMPDSKAVASISVATNEAWKDKQTGEKQERTEWHRVTLYGKLAEIAGQYLKKGAMVYIEGSLRTDKYQDKQTGEDKYSTKIVASDMQMLGGNSGGGEKAQATQQAKPAVQGNTNGGGSSRGVDDFNDDIPFGPLNGMVI